MTNNRSNLEGEGKWKQSFIYHLLLNNHRKYKIVCLKCKKLWNIVSAHIYNKTLRIYSKLVCRIHIYF